MLCLLPSPLAHSSVIPLKGGENSTSGKRPALRWKPYTRRQPTPDELHEWFVKTAHAAYGVVCGAVSGLVVLDVDSPATLTTLTVACPHLLDTFTVQSGNRALPHVYWRVDFPVASRSLAGADLKAEGSYVVGPGSVIAGKTWTVVNDCLLRAISPDELAMVQRLLDKDTITTAPSPETVPSMQVITPSPVMPASVTSWSIADVRTMYQSQVRATEERNNTLFALSCQLRDAGYSREWAVHSLAALHASTPSAPNQLDEPYQHRYREALRTIASAFSHPPRRRSSISPVTHDEPTSRLPNSIRETLLQQDHGIAILRTYEGLCLQGWQPGHTFTQQQAITALKGLVGERSIRNAMQQWPFCPPDKNAVFSMIKIPDGGSAIAGGVPGGALHIFPSVETLAAKLNVLLTPGDPLTINDISSVKQYRMALNRCLIQRQPGQYSQQLLGERLNVSSRTIRRYVADDDQVNSRPGYDERHIGWHNLNTLPTQSEAKQLLAGGHFLMDNRGCKYPLGREIAARLLKQARQVVYCVQTVNFYWCGDDDQVALRKTPAFEKRFVKEPLLPVTEKNPASQPHPLPVAPSPPANLIPEPSIPDHQSVPVVFVRTIQPRTPVVTGAGTRPARHRSYRKALPDREMESLAAWIHRDIEDLSLPNARRLVVQYGVTPVRAAMKRTRHLMYRNKLRNPAGFLITLCGAGYYKKYGRSEVFRAERPRSRRRPYNQAVLKADPLWQSVPYLRWYILHSHLLNLSPLMVDYAREQLHKLGHDPDELRPLMLESLPDGPPAYGDVPF